MPIYGAKIGICLAGSDEAAFIFLDELGGEVVSTTPQLISNTEGFFEFWIGDSSEQGGYSSTQKFKITWERIGVESGMIDHIDIFPITLPVDVSDDDTERNKSVSNQLAKGWETHRLSDNHNIHGIQEINLAIDLPKKNKLISNSLGILWQNHRLYNYNTNITTSQLEHEKTMWEANPEQYGGAHGLQQIDVVSDTRSDTCYNKLMNNAIGNKWDEHVNYNFRTDEYPKPGYNFDLPHGLDFINIADIPENATEEQLKEYISNNKIVSNALIKEILNNISNKPSTFVKKILSTDWKVSILEPGVYMYTLYHGLKTEYVGISTYHVRERLLDDGKIEYKKALFSPEDVYILSENEIEISVTRAIDIDVMLWAHSNVLSGDIIGSKDEII